MKKYLQILLLIFLPFFMNAQPGTLDSLKNVFTTTPVDSVRYNAGRKIYDYYEEGNRDSALYYASQYLALAKKNGEKLAEVYALNNTAYQLTGLGRYAEALQYLLEAFNIVEDPALEKEKSWPLFSSSFSTAFTGSTRLLMLAYTHHMMGILMWQTDNNEQSIFHFREARNISSTIGHTTRLMMASMNLGRSYANSNQLDSALLSENEAEELSNKSGFTKYLGQIYQVIGQIYSQKGNKELARQYYYKAIQKSSEPNNRNVNSLNSNYFTLTSYYLAEREKDSALKYAMLNLSVQQTLGPVSGRTIHIGTVYENIYRAYKLTNNYDSIFKYQGLTLTAKDSIYKIRIKNLTDFQTANFGETLRLQNLEKEKQLYQNKIKMYFLLAGLGMLFLLAVVFYLNNRQKKKANKVLAKTLSDLTATQAQLIQSEKMASLGELTAGIAHEIQNPLNFVNNFSEVNTELIAELKSEKEKSTRNEQLETELLNDIEENEKKIIYHGKRADAIVKGMLQHSRSSSGVKESTDINALCDEYLRLSYHGLRAKDKSFNATIKTDFDTTIGNINIVSQDMGRVILNLLTNAFYAVNEKKQQNIAGYEPSVTISTKKINGKIEIRIADNGNGIPQKILDKIFQPFFTTKPTGQGTGLGLSLSYDIITKGHGGKLEVETKELEGTQFIIQLPA
jgi:two-component system, NtrC family, sensor kinase